MIIVLLCVGIGLAILGACMCDKMYDETFGEFIAMVGAFGIIVCVIAFVVLCVIVSGLNVIDAKIEMYQEENTNIESQIAECVKQYQEYEKEIFTEVTPESAVTLVSLYPELKADELVSKQIDVYLANNQKIKELKEHKISGCVYRWWLYFGSSEKEGVGE